MSGIQFCNTLSGRIEPFVPMTPGEVKLYACGPTVYDYAHIGNFRAFVFEDLLRRFLEFKGYKVHHVMNLTDVDDKTIAGANREKKALDDFTAAYIQAFNEDLKTLNILPPSLQPRATREIHGKGGMIELIETLIQKEIAYVNEGSVYYRVGKFSGYGKLSKKKMDQNIAGASSRVDVDEYDRDQISDFVLWKKAKEGEPSWDSPWGKGRPGWHIECSSMSMKYLGETFDIHAGGEDLVFPHHENEIAQSEAATGKPFVKYWMHCKFLLVNNAKMSKSKGNFYTLRDLMAKGYDPMAIRFELLSTHYRQQVNFTEDGIRASKEALNRIRDFWYKISFGIMEVKKDSSTGKLSSLIKSTRKLFIDALSNDLNISEGMGQVFTFIKQANSIPDQEISTKEYKEADAFLNELDNVLGVFSQSFISGDVPPEVKEILESRAKARHDKKFELADSLRNQARTMGYIFEDMREGTRVKKVL